MSKPCCKMFCRIMMTKPILKHINEQFKMPNDIKQLDILGV